MKIGVLGGTFDPPHLGHLALAEAAIAQLDLDEVVFVPANRNPIKAIKTVTSPKHRVAMVELLVRDHPQLAYSDMEITRGGPSFTVDTLTELQMVTPAEYWFIMGADALRNISEWKSPNRLIRLCRIAAAIRPPHTVQDVLVRLPEEFKSSIDPIQMTGVELSSTEIRDKIAGRLNVTPWLSPEVLQYIQANKLYI